METGVPPPPPAEPPQSGGGFRAVALLVRSPSEAFKELGRSPQWIFTFVVVAALLATAAWIRAPQEMVFANTASIATMERLGVQGQDFEDAMAAMPDPDNLTGADIGRSVGTAVGFLLPILFVAGAAFWGLMRAFGVNASYGAALGVYLMAKVGTAAVEVVRAMLIRASDSVAVALSPAAVLSEESFLSMTWLLLDIPNLGAAVDLYLLALGIQYALGAKSNTAWTASVTWIVVASLFRFGTQAFSSWMAGLL